MARLPVPCKLTFPSRNAQNLRGLEVGFHARENFPIASWRKNPRT